MTGKSRWPLWAMVALGLWLTTVPFSYGWRNEAEILQALFIGTGIAALSLFCRLFPPASHLAYLNSFLGVWLLGGNLLFSVPGPLWVGPAILGLSLVIPTARITLVSDCPPGWFHNPSTWIQRLPVITLMSLGAIIARPHRLVSFLFLAGLSSVLIGDRRRWRTSPWTVFLSFVSFIVCVLSSVYWLSHDTNPFGLGAFVAATIAATLSADELLAARNLLRHAAQLGQTLSASFWVGAQLPADDFMPRPNHRATWSPPQGLRRRRHSRRRQSRRLI